MHSRLTDFASCAGCAGKLAPNTISQILHFLPQSTDRNLLVGTETHDDAGIYRLTDEIALVQTLDFFPPVVDDPFIYGQIAAANALSDVYAMGGTPKTVLNLVGYPDDELGDLDWLGKILQGGADRCQAADAVIVGGHTVRDREIKFGLSVTGIVHPLKFWTNAGAKPGDLLILTKPLGVGFVTSALRKQQCPDEIYQESVASMIQLNRVGKEAIESVGGASAVTDITGFGFAGHALEMAMGSKVTLKFYLNQLPLLPGLLENDLIQFRTRASRTNYEYVKPHLQMANGLDPRRCEILWDPQTSGGLLISIDPNRAEKLKLELRSREARCFAIVGEVEALQQHHLHFC